MKTGLVLLALSSLIGCAATVPLSQECSISNSGEVSCLSSDYPVQPIIPNPVNDFNKVLKP